MYTQDLENLILKRHHENGADNIIILGGYVGPSPIEKISKEKIHCKVIYGCKSHSLINSDLHKKYVSISKSTETEVLYKENYNHSKIYCWLKDNDIVEIIAGLANFSTIGLNNDYQETLFEIKKNDYNEVYVYLLDALKDSVSCIKKNIHKIK
jgi:hypothetical protein